MTNTGRKTTSWGWIIFWLILFWPIGLLLLVKKLAIDKSATLKSGKGITVASYILMGLGAIYIMMAFSNPEMLAAAVLFGGGGVLMNWFARKTKHTGERYKKYIAMIVNQNETSIDNIASATNVPYDVVMKDLQKMIDSGYFTGAYIDMSQREIILARAVQPVQTIQPVQQQVYLSPAFAYVQEAVVACGSCGARSRVTVGRISECEYCGSPLQAK
jgi:hypothetical protein